MTNDELHAWGGLFGARNLSSQPGQHIRPWGVGPALVCDQRAAELEEGKVVHLAASCTTNEGSLGVSADVQPD
jgi:hypothetical protein